MKTAFYCSLLILGCQWMNAQVPRYNYHVKNRVIINNNNHNLIRMALVLPLAQTNQYQTVSNVNTHGGELLPVPNTDDLYVRWHFNDDRATVNQVSELYYEFDVVLNAYSFDFEKLGKIFPYDTTSDLFVRYTGSSGAYVNPHHPVIEEISESLWNNSVDIVDYAKKCYEYVATNYKYINPFTGLHPLQAILKAGGGDCGNLSSIYISLLRNKKIPARHIVTVKPNGEYHVWADFYLERHGWIPVDVTFKNSDPEGNYFGVYDGNGIVMTKDVWLPLEMGEGEIYFAEILQSYYLWTWTNPVNPPVSNHKLTSIRYALGESMVHAD